MGLLETIKTLIRREASSSGDASPDRVVSPRGGGGLTVVTCGGDDLGVATVYRCVKLLSDSVAGLRLQYMSKKGGRYVEDVENPLHYLMTVQPQPEMSAYTFWSLAVQQMLLLGDAYIFPRYVLGELTDLVLCHRGTVSHDTINGTYSIHDGWNGVYGTFGESEVIHLFMHSPDGLRGESVLAHARRTISIAQAGDAETQNRFEKGGNVRGILSNVKNGVTGFGEYQDTQMDAAAKDIDTKFQQGERIVNLPGDVDFKQISLSSTDMQFLESRKFTVREICRFFGVNPSFTFDDGSTNYKSAENATSDFLSRTLDPILKRIENEMTRKLIPRSECCRHVMRYDRRGIWSLDLQSLADYQKKTIESGIYTVNDWRRMENQPQVDGGDKVLVSANLKAINEL